MKHRTNQLTKVPWCHKHFSWNKNMTVCVTERKLTWKTWSEQLRRIWGVDQPVFIGQKVLDITSFLGTLQCCLIQQLGCFFLFSCLGLLLGWPTCLFIPFLFCTFFSTLGLTPWAVFQNTLCRHAGKQLTQVACYSQPVMHLPEVGGYHLSVFPQLETPRAIHV